MLTGAGAALGVVSVSARRTYRALEAAAARRQTAYEFLMALRQLRQHVGEVRVGLTGYALTRDSAYRAIYAGGIGGLASDTVALRRLAASGPTLQEPLDRLGPAVAAYAEAMATAMRSVERDSPPAVGSQLRRSRDILLLEGIRSVIAALEREQVRLMETGAREVAEAVRRSRVMITAVLVVGVFLILGAGGAAFAQLLAREMERRTRDYADRLEERGRQLEEANQELDSFSHSVSHDLRAPLRTIDGFSAILSEEHGTALDEDGKRLVSVIREKTKAMTRLIDDLLAFSRLGRQPIRATEVNMAQLVRTTVDEVSSLASERALEVHVGSLPPALGDASLLKQVWLNLLSNAVKYTRPRERAVIDVAGAIEGGEVVYTVRDNGVGFDMRYAARLFGVFQRLHAPHEFEGTGVGLALVQRGGRVWAEGKPDEGAVFYFSLPRATGGRLL
jgi:signal transduction histidine kinase